MFGSTRWNRQGAYAQAWTVQSVLGPTSTATVESRPSTISLITLGTNQTGKSCAANAYARFDVAGTGNRAGTLPLRQSSTVRRGITGLVRMH
jgi:hypothetical protein